MARELGLDRLAERFELGDELRGSANVLAALVESVIAALYLEHGLERIAGLVRAAFLPRIVEAEETPFDYKTQLQEAAAARGHRVAYAILSSDGPPHDRLFTSAAMVDGRQRGVGSGRSKKDAEQEAAREALRVLEVATE